jgi:hypothetical protein
LRRDVNGSIPYARTVNSWFDPGVFNQRQLGQRRPRYRPGAGYVVFNLRLQKSVHLERLGAIQVVASFNNVLNHTNLGEPSKRRCQGIGDCEQRQCGQDHRNLLLPKFRFRVTGARTLRLAESLRGSSGAMETEAMTGFAAP